MIETGLIKVTSIENEEIIMTITKIIITTVIMKIIIMLRMIVRIKIGNLMPVIPA